jgi:hypothetical protein
MSADRPSLSPSTVGNFFRLQSCPMYLQWEYNDIAQKVMERRDWEKSDPSLVLTSEGDTFEQTQLEHLDTADTRLYGIETSSTDHLDFVDTWADDASQGTERVRELLEGVASAPVDTPTTVIFQPHVTGRIGAYPIEGKGDMLILDSTDAGVRPMVLEVKSSSEQKVYHRYQATIYAVLVERLADDLGVNLDVEGDHVPAKVITPNNSLNHGIETARSFDVGPYYAKLELKLKEGGSFDQTLLETSFEGTTNRIAQRCSGCEYESHCVSRAVESQGLELLGLQAGTQEVLHDLGVDTVSDFANLYEEDFEDSVHWDYSTPQPADFDLARRVRQDAEVTNLQKRVQIAYQFLGEIDDRYGDGWDFKPTPLRGTGNNVPEDEHGDDADWTQWKGPDYPSGSLIRVYPYVQQDHAQDRITMMAARVACTHTGYDETIVVPPKSIPTVESEKKAEEDRLFTEFFKRLAQAVEEANPDFDGDSAFDYIEVPEEHGFLHLYFYSNEQRKALVDAIDDHGPSQWGRPLRTLLGLRAGIDQEMVTIFQDDFRQRWALRFPGLGTIQSTAQFNDDDEWFDWRPTVEESELPLDEIFDTGLFDGAVRYHSEHGGDLRGAVEFDHSDERALWTPDDKRLAQWYYPVMNRDADQIPVEYLWGAYGRLDEEVAEDPEDVKAYLYRNEDTTDPITEDDVEELAGKFAGATEHIERTLQSTNKYATDKYINKEPIPLEALGTFSFDQRNLQEVCIEYQQLEYQTDKDELTSYYRQPLAERIDTGSSFVFRVTNVNKDYNRIEGELLEPTASGYESLSEEQAASLSVSDNDFMVLTRLDPDSGDRPEEPRKGKIENIANSTTVIVSSLNRDGFVALSSPFTNGWPNYDDYTVGHRGWSNDEDAIEEEWSTYVAEGETYAVDPMLDKITQNRAYEALENAVDTPVHRWVSQLYDERRQRVDIEGWEQDAVTDYLDRMADCENFSRPKYGQDDFIEDVSHGLITLQGPPGTGKTKFTISPSVLSRVHSDVRNGESHLGVVSAVSHTAVDEALEAILGLHDACPPGGDANSVDFVRICSSASQGVDHDAVQNVYYNEASDAELSQLYERYLGDDAERALFFGPPVSIRSGLNNLIKAGTDDQQVSDWMKTGESAIFDLAVIDEASMMDLPLFFLLGAFVADGGQMMLVGDHRQMQPIQKHDWASEDREPIERHRPFLSTLDFFRFLRGDEDVELDLINRNPPELDNPEAALPDHKLRATYRLPPESARMHTDLFYEQDGITLTSKGDEPAMPAASGPMADVLASDDRITLLVHDESNSQKSNPVEQALAAELLQHDGFEICEPGSATGGDDSTISAGIVVPFRAQRRDLVDQVPDAVAVDTVERFQGGERDLMVLSMSASDRGYISQISEFLLEPNRFNVGASRMSRKLVVIASSAIFEASSNDVDVFEDQEAWISFFQSMGGLDGSPETFQITELVGDDLVDELLDDDDVVDTTVRVYSGYD